MSITKNFKMIILSALLLATVLTFNAFTFSSSAHAATMHQSSAAVIAKAASCPGTLRQGSQGTSVKALQGVLNNLYYNYSDIRYFKDSPKDFGPYTQDASLPLRVDGDFGSHTFNAVWDYQYWNGLGQDGVVGPQTWHSLGFC